MYYTKNTEPMFEFFLEPLFTFGLRSFIVKLAQKFFIIHEVEF